VHPNVYNLIHPPIAVLGWLATRIAGAKASVMVRAEGALLVAPIAGATRSALLFETLITVFESLPIAIVTTWLSMVSFSGSFFGVIPESFGLSGAGSAWLFYLAALAFQRERVSRAAWLVAGTFLVGVTITHGIAFATLVFLVARRHGLGWWAALRRAITWTATVAVFVVAICFGLSAMEGRIRDLRAGAGQLHECRPSALAVVCRFPRALVDSVVPSWPRWMLADLDRGTHVRVVRLSLRDDVTELLRDDPRIQFVPPPLGTGVEAVAATFLVLLGCFSALGMRNVSSWKRSFLHAAVWSLLVQWLFHSFFGLELFLYSQHWLVPLMLVLAAGLTTDDRGSPAAFGILAALATLAAHQTAWLLKFIADLRL